MMKETLIVKKITAYKVGSMIFERRVDAERYQYESLSPLQVGDHVAVKGGLVSVFGVFGIQGRVCHIEYDKVWIMKGNCPEDVLLKGHITRGAIDYEINGKIYSWDIAGIQNRRNLIKGGYLPFVKAERPSTNL